MILIVSGAGEESRRVGVNDPPLRPYRAINIASGSLGAIVRAYKASMTVRINTMRGSSESPVWQSNYCDQIIRMKQNMRKFGAILKLIR
jgi:hypothetical protein